MLPPYQRSKGADWYKGTANAIYQNIPFIERYDPEYVLVLSGDHIYKMDYSKMIAFHKEHEAACTIAVIEVPLEEASRFGILNTHEDGAIYEFDEKPAVPKNNLASMGIYVFNWRKLRQLPRAGRGKPASRATISGRTCSRRCCEAGERMFAYRFEGYWKDVGTIDSLWEANMDLLNPKVPLDMSDLSWRIYSRNPGLPPHYIGPHAEVQNSMITEGGNVCGKVDFSVLFSGVTVEEGAEIRDSILMPGTHVKRGARVQYAILAENVTVEENAVIGQRPEEAEDARRWGVAVVASGVTVGASAVVPAKAMLNHDVKEGERV